MVPLPPSLDGPTASRFLIRRLAGSLHRAAPCIAFVFLHAGAGAVARLFPLLPEVSVGFLPVGVSIAFAMLHGWRTMPLIALALLAGSGDLSWTGVAHAVRHGVVYAALGALCRPMSGNGAPFGNAADMLRFCILAVAGTALSAWLAGMIFLLSGNPSGIAAEALLGFWVGDLSGALLLTPPALLVLRAVDGMLRENVRSFLPDFRPLDLLAAAAMLAALALSVVLLVRVAPAANGLAWALPVVPVAIAALLHGVTAAAAISVVAILATVLHGAALELLDAQASILVACFVGMLIGTMAEERSRSERRLREAVAENRLFAAALEGAAVPVSIHDAARPGMPVLFANGAFGRLFGGAPADFTGRLCPTLQKAVHGGAVPAGGPHVAEVPVRDAGGRHFVVRTALSPVTGEEGRPLAWVAFHEDAARRGHHPAGGREQERLAVLGRLAGDVAHELANLLHPIGNLVRQAEREMDGNPDAVRDYLRIARDCAGRGGEIVRRVLDFSRPGPDRRGRLSLVDAVHSAAAIVGCAVPHGIRIEIAPAGGTPHIRLTMDEAHQVVANLMMNAAHAMSGQGTMRLRLGVLDLDQGAPCVPALAPGCYAFLSVIDEGCGMDEETRARMFEPFFSTKPRGGGTGLGLSIVYGIVESAGGGLLVHSVPGHGSDITVLLPLEKA